MSNKNENLEDILIGIGVVIIVLAILASMVIPGVVATVAARHRDTKVITTCVQNGKQWTRGSCIDGSGSTAIAP